MDNNVADVLSAVHALTSYDTTSRVGAKSAAFQAANCCIPLENQKFLIK